MPLLPIDDPRDPRLGAYRSLRDRDLLPQGEAGSFLAEAWFVVERLLARPELVRSIVIEPRFVARLPEAIVAEVPVYVLQPEIFGDLVGFAFHRGIMAHGSRQGVAFESLDELVPGADGPVTLLVCEGITNIDNMGLLFRNAAAFGVHGVLLGPECCDPLYRKALRVGIGNALHVPWMRSSDLRGDLERLGSEYGFVRLASRLSERARDFAAIEPPSRAAVVVGHEGHGIEPATAAVCDVEVVVPMAAGVDSLNVAVAAAVLLSRFRNDRVPD